MAKDDSLQAIIMLIGGGTFLFYSGLKHIRLRRKVEDIPTSKISTGAIGSFVEVVGKVAGKEELLLKSPLTDRRGYSYLWFIEERADKVWLPVATYASSPFIYITDDEGETFAALDLAGCDLSSFAFEERTFTDMSWDIPAEVKEILHQEELLKVQETNSYFSMRSFRIREKVFSIGELLYVLGTAVEKPRAEISLSHEPNWKFGKAVVQNIIEEHFKVASGDPETIPHYDKDKNSNLDFNEKKVLRNHLKKVVFQDYDLKSENEFLDRTKMCFTKCPHNTQYLFTAHPVISVGSEKTFMKELNSSVWHIVLGPLMVVAGLGYIYYKFY